MLSIVISRVIYFTTEFQCQTPLKLSHRFFVECCIKLKQTIKEGEMIYLVDFFFSMNKVTLTQTKSSNVIISSDITEGSLEKMMGVMVKMDSELKEVKEKLCTLTAPVGENKDEGQLNYTIKLNLYIVSSS